MGPSRASPDGVHVLVVGQTDTARVEMSLALMAVGFPVAAADPNCAVQIVDRQRPDLTVVVAPSPPRVHELLRALASRPAPHRVVIVTSSQAPSEVIAALRAGVRGYLPSTIDPAGLARALRSVLAGEIALSRQLVTALIEEMRLNFGDGADATLSPLTMRELQVLALLREGSSNGEIADRLGIAAVTVRRHVSAIRRKLGGPAP